MSSGDGEGVIGARLPAPALARPSDHRSPYPAYVLFVLFLIYVSNFADRQVVAILAQAIKKDLRLSDWQLGLLTGPAIAAFYAVLGLPMGYLADRVRRVRFLGVCLVLWSAFTTCGALARNLIQLALTRVGVSIAEAGGTPISVSLLADYFPATRRATALGIYSSATPIGVLTGFALGGIINDCFGWRGALVAAGIPGVVLSLLLLVTVREPVRGAKDPSRAAGGAPPQTTSLFDVARRLWSIPQYRRMVLTSAGPNVTIYVLLSWAPALAIRTFHMSTTAIGPLIGLGFAVLGAGAIVLGGLICDHLTQRGQAGAAVRLTGLVQLLVVPFLTLALFTHTFWVFIVAVSLAYGAAEFFAAPCWSVTQNAAPPEMRASAAALMVLVFTGFGLGVGPPLVGAASDLLVGRFGVESLKYALLIPVAFSALSGVLYFWTAAALPARGPIAEPS